MELEVAGAGNIDKAMQGDADSVKWLNNHFAKQRENLLVSKVRGENAKPVSAEEAFKQRKTAASTVFSSVFKANPEAKAFVDELSDHFNPGGVFDALGIDILDAFADEARGNEFVKLGQAVNTFNNLEKIVEARVTAELERRRTAGNAGGAGKQGAKGAVPADSAKEFDATSIFR